MRRATILFALLLALPAASGAESTAAERLDELLRDEWQQRLLDDPLFATAAGRHDYDDRLPDVGLEAYEERVAGWRALLERLDTIDRDALPPPRRIDYDMIRRELGDRLAEVAFGGHLVPLTAETGFHTDLARLPERSRLTDAADYERYLARLRAVPRYFEQHEALLLRGLEKGMVLPRVVLDGYESTIAPHVVEDPVESVFFAPFTSFPAAVPEEDRKRLAEAGRSAVAEAVVPAYRRLLEFMTGSYIPGARPTVGASALPPGAGYYAHLVRRYTTLDLTAEQVHAIGREEVARIRGEMEEVIARTGFEGSFDEFLGFLRTDPRFYAETPEALLKEAAWIAKRMDGALPGLFGRLPRLPYGVEAVPDHLAPKYTAGRYVEPPAGSGRPGLYWVNTYDLPSRPLYALPALTLHEAVPGHHLQIALQLELEALPQFRRFSGLGAFVEGWALYAELLGIEAGIYRGPYEEFGRLTYEMWRACRLVVDTGLHAMGWSRQQALDYLAGNTALSLHEVTTEIDRYISWPGQALGYKMGELTIRRLRREAEQTLGPRFDLRAFHDAVLENGPVPLSVLEDRIRAWIASRLEFG